MWGTTQHPLIAKFSAVLSLFYCLDILILCKEYMSRFAVIRWYCQVLNVHAVTSVMFEYQILSLHPSMSNTNSTFIPSQPELPVLVTVEYSRCGYSRWWGVDMSENGKRNSCGIKLFTFVYAFSYMISTASLPWQPTLGIYFPSKLYPCDS